MMRVLLAVVVALACATFPLALSARSPEPSAWYATGQAAYDEDRFVEAAQAFAKGLGGVHAEAPAEELDRAAYLLMAILFYQPAADLDQIVGRVDGLDAGLVEVSRAMRAKERRQASHALAFLRFREAELPDATRRLLDTMEAHTGPVEESYVRVWSREVAHAVDVATDEAGRAWVLVVEPPSFVRLDRTGEQVERVPFVPPETISAAGLAKAHFALRSDGGFQLGTHRYSADGRLIDSDRLYAPKDAAPAEEGTTVYLHDDGLRAVGADGSLRWQRLGRGMRSGSFNHPLALALGTDSIFVAEYRRLQRFSRAGEFEAALGADAAARLPDGFKVSGLNDVSSAEDRVFVGHLNARTVEVYSTAFEPLAAFRLEARRLAASHDGMVYGLREERLSAAIEVPAESRKAKQARHMPIPEPVDPVSRERWRSEITPVSFATLEGPPTNVQLHVSTRHVTSLAARSIDAPTVLIGSYGGLMRWTPGVEGPAGWRHWSRMDGFPSDVVHDVHEEPDGTIWVVVGGGVLVRRPGEKVWSQLERGGFPVNGKAVVGDANRPGYVWIAAQRGLFHLAAGATEAAFVRMKRGPEEVVEWPDGRLFVRLGVNGIAEVDPETGETDVLVEMEDLRSLPGVRRPGSDHWIMTLAADPAENALWLGTDQRELFALDVETRRIRSEWIDGALGSSCQRGEIRAERIGGDLHVLGFGCHAVRASGSEALRLVFEHPGRGLDMLETTDGIFLATSEGLYRVDPDSAPTPVRRPVSEPPDWAPISMAQVDGRVWVGFGNRGVGIFDGSEWREVEAAGSVGRFRVERDGVLAIASHGYGGAYRIDRDGEQIERVAPGGRSWSFLRDLFFDGEQWWAVGGPDPRRKHGLRRHRAGRDEHWGRAVGMPFGEARRIVADPSSPDLLWLASDVGLVRVDKETRAAEVVWPGDVRWLDRFADGSLWAYGSELLRFDPESGIGSPFPFSGIPASDPSETDVLWMVSDGKLLRLDASNGQVLSSHEIGLGSLHVRGVEVLSTPVGRSVWIATSDGLVEVRVEAGAVPARPAALERRSD